MRGRLGGRRNESPENSPGARLAILAAAAVAQLALAVSAGLYLPVALALTGTALGHLVSWRGRARRRRVAGQALTGLLLLGATAYLLDDLLTSAFGGELPQAKFALAAQAITAFDLKTRRNLFSHLWHSLAILYIAALLGYSATFLSFMLLWGVAAWLFLHWARESAPVQGWPSSRTLRWMAAWMALAALVFILLPRFPGRPFLTPLAVSVPLTNLTNSSTPTGRSLPAALPLVATQAVPATGEIDLRARGQLGDEVLFHVRSSGESYWRTSVLDVYTHTEWKRGGPNANAGEAAGILVKPLIAGEPTSDGPVLTQSFFVDRPLGVEIPAAYPVRELYFPARSVTVDRDGSFDSPMPLRPGLAYTVTSLVRDYSPARLRGVPPLPLSDLEPDTQLPSGMPSRLGLLAGQLAARGPTEYDLVIADIDYVRAHTRYRVDAPPLPASADAVDRFLFVDHLGFCEQYASAVAILLRLQGVPARVAIGFTPGERDPFTGTYAVRAHDAHAWDEVYFPTVGWVPVDATPGQAIVPAARSVGGAFLGDLRVDVNTLSVSTGAGGQAATALILPGALALVAILLSGWWRGRPPDRARRRYRAAQWWLRWAGLPSRLPQQTVAEHLSLLKQAWPRTTAALAPLADGVERSLYGAPGGGPEGKAIRVAGEAFAERLLSLLGGSRVRP